MFLMKGKSKCKVINNGFSQAKSDTRNKSSESDLGHGLVIFGIVSLVVPWSCYRISVVNDSNGFDKHSLDEVGKA